MISDADGGTATAQAAPIVTAKRIIPREVSPRLKSAVLEVLDRLGRGLEPDYKGVCRRQFLGSPASLRVIVHKVRHGVLSLTSHRAAAELESQAAISDLRTCMACVRTERMLHASVEHLLAEGPPGTTALERAREAASVLRTIRQTAELRARAQKSYLTRLASRVPGCTRAEALAKAQSSVEGSEWMQDSRALDEALARFDSAMASGKAPAVAAAPAAAPGDGETTAPAPPEPTAQPA